MVRQPSLSVRLDRVLGQQASMRMDAAYADSAVVVPLCLAEAKTPALMKLKMLVDLGHEVQQYWELEEDEGADMCSGPVPIEPSSSMRGGGVEAFGSSGPRVPYSPEIKGYNPEYTRPVFTNLFHHDLSAFAIDEESTIQPLRHTDAPAACLVWSANILSIKVLRSSVGYPVNLYGSVYVRDDLDRKRVYLFRRDRDKAQLVKSPEESLVLTGPSRGLVISDNLFFEIDLKMRCDQQVVDFSQGMMQYSHVTNSSWIVDHRSCLLADELATEVSTVELMYAPVQRAVEASIRIKALGSPHREGVLSLYGKVTAFITETPEEIVLFDSEASGAVMNIRDDGSFELWRSVISVPIDGSLTLRVETWEGDSKVNLSKCSTIFLPQICDENVASCTFHPIRIKVAWSPLYVYSKV